MKLGEYKPDDVALRAKVSIPLTKSMLDRLREIADRRNVTLAQIARDLIVAGLAGVER